MKIPENLKYTDHDEWVRIEGDKIVVGITDFAQDQLGEAHDQVLILTFRIRSRAIRY
jgi:glycine cleavage system H lipoate-binding protein